LYVLGDYGEDGKSSFLRPRKFKPAVRADSNGHGRRPAPAPSVAPASGPGSRESEAESAAEGQVPAAVATDPPAGDPDIDF
ncbi:MAG: hypothetical protein ACREQM_05595, partial [Candidatus Dormibacteraceae bacterium]